MGGGGWQVIGCRLEVAGRWHEGDRCAWWEAHGEHGGQAGGQGSLWVGVVLGTVAWLVKEGS